MATAMQTTIRLGPEDLAILEAIQTKTGIFSRSDALRFALRRYAELDGIDFSAARPKRRKKKK